VHVTFLLLLVWLVLASDAPNPFREALFVVCIFACILAHEFAHALVAKRCGIKTRDITLYPFGGVAAILKQPTPKAEVAIALAGPLLNVVIAAALYLWIDLPVISDDTPRALSFSERLLISNIALALFNLLPALPMDGGRVLRALLGIFKVKNATLIAARISQGICLLMAIAALPTEQPMLFVIAFIIFFGAIQEYVRAESRLVAHAFVAADAMIPKEKLETFAHGTTISKALRSALTSLQPLYPITVQDGVVGVVFREDIVHHAATQPDEYLSAIMVRSIPTIEASAPLGDAFNLLDETGMQVLMVVRDGTFIGLIVYERLTEFLLLQGLRQQEPKDDDAQWQLPM
jgi:Zn-dependent protease/CBS domain-containing protein